MSAAKGRGILAALSDAVYQVNKGDGIDDQRFDASSQREAQPNRQPPSHPRVRF